MPLDIILLVIAIIFFILEGAKTRIAAKYGLQSFAFAAITAAAIVWRY